MAFLTVSGLVKILSGVAVVDRDVVPLRDPLEVREVALRAPAGESSHVAAAQGARLGDDRGRIGQLGRLEVRRATSRSRGRCCSRTGAACSGSRARSGS